MEGQDERPAQENEDVALAETAVIRFEQLEESLGFFRFVGSGTFDFDLSDIGIMDLL
jgi:hypothetical protein